MSSYCVSVGGKEYTVQVVGTSVTVNGELVSGDLVSLNGNGLHQFSRGDQSFELYFTARPRGTYEVLVGGRCVVARVEPAHRRALRRSDARAAGDLVAPMPGLVVDVQASEGDAVTEGQVLVVIESMKMQMQICAPFEGCVARMHVEIGAQVDKDTILVQVEPVQNG